MPILVASVVAKEGKEEEFDNWVKGTLVPDIKRFEEFKEVRYFAGERPGERVLIAKFESWSALDKTYADEEFQKTVQGFRSYVESPTYSCTYLPREIPLE